MNQYQQLVGLQRAEFAQASTLQNGLIVIQLSIAILAAATVWINNDTIGYLTGVTALLLSALWALGSWKFKSVREVAERARRASVIVGGFGKDISVEDYRAILAVASASSTRQEQFKDDAYYAAATSAGPERLADMLEESAFWSCHLLRTCATVLWITFSLVLAWSLALLFSSVPFVDSPDLLTAVRIVCSTLSLIVSADFMGAALAYSSAAGLVATIPSRLARTRGAGFPMHDLVAILCDYNSAVESAPLFLPGVYAAKRERLNALWQQTRAKLVTV